MLNMKLYSFKFTIVNFYFTCTYVDLDKELYNSLILICTFNYKFALRLVICIDRKSI